MFTNTLSKIKEKLSTPLSNEELMSVSEIMIALSKDMVKYYNNNITLYERTYSRNSVPRVHKNEKTNKETNDRICSNKNDEEIGRVVQR